MNIKAIREKHGLSQQQLADHLFIGRTMVALMETGKKNIPRHVSIKLNEPEDQTGKENIQLINPGSLYKQWFLEDNVYLKN